jgi:hypothetical protein
MNGYRGRSWMPQIGLLSNTGCGEAENWRVWQSLIGADRTKTILALSSLLGYLAENFEIAELDSHGLFAHQNELSATFGAQLDEDGCRK